MGKTIAHQFFRSLLEPFGAQSIGFLGPNAYIQKIELSVHEEELFKELTKELNRLQQANNHFATKQVTLRFENIDKTFHFYSANY